MRSSCGRLQASRHALTARLDGQHEFLLMKEKCLIKSLESPQGQKNALLGDLKSCSLRRDLQWGRRIHAKVVETGNDSLYIVTALIRTYTKCRSMVEAHRVFKTIHKPDAACWNALLLGYADNGEGHICLELFAKMKSDGHAPSSVTYIAALKACTTLAVNGDATAKAQALEIGRSIHSNVGCCLNLYVQNTLVDMYAKCGSMVEARRAFDGIQSPDVVSWTALLLGYVENGEGKTCLDLFSKMKAGGCPPNYVTYIAALKACASLAAIGDSNGRAQGLEAGRSIHSEIECNLNFYRHKLLVLQNTLIDMYAKCGSVAEARRVFEGIQKPDVVSWTVLLLGYVDNGEGHVSLDLFSRMKAEGCAPNSVTYIALLKACTSLAVNGDASDRARGLEAGSEIHSEIGSDITPYVQSTLIDMYAKCGSMVKACEVFYGMKNPSVVAWTALILGYADNGKGHDALDMFSKMKAKGCAPDGKAYVAVLKACTSLAVNGDKAYGLEMGSQIHSEIGDDLDPYMRSVLIDMYAKCGSITVARRVFDSIPRPDVVSWNALLSGYEDNGEGHVALDLFSKMKAGGCAPNTVTYIAALKACGSIGALVLGRKLHSEMRDFTVHVVTCLIDFYAKCGSMVEAREVFDRHPKARSVTAWTALLTGYSSCGETDLVFNEFEAMLDAGFLPDRVTFLCVLSCCNHAGLVKKAREYLETMTVKYGVTPDVCHYSCIIDLLGRANQLVEAAAVLRKMPCSPSAVTWSALLGACSKWKNVRLGKMVFQSWVEMNETDASTYVLMAQIYGSRGMRDEQERVLQSRTKHSSLREQAHVVDEMGKMVKFVVGQKDSPEVEHKLAQLLEDVKKHGFSLADEEDEVCGHSERRAVAYGILKTPPGEQVRVFKNTRMCESCHELTKILSKLSGRVVMVRDTSRFHVMADGSCSCGDLSSAD